MDIFATSANNLFGPVELAQSSVLFSAFIDFAMSCEALSKRAEKWVVVYECVQFLLSRMTLKR